MIGSENPVAAEQASSTDTKSEKQTRERSRIEFPYADLENAVEMVRTLHARSGTRCEVNQLAIWLNQTASGGTFRTRLSASKIFGLIETDRGFVSLTDLGLSIVEDPGSERSARSSAFLNAPLFGAPYEQFEGHSLPPAAALERQIVALGVPEKQKERARQTFLKSAHYAGFIDQQTGRLIKPGTGPVTSVPSAQSSSPVGGGDGGGQPPRDPLIEVLFREVPARGTEWPAEDQVRWLETAAHIFALAFKRRERIRVELENAK